MWGERNEALEGAVVLWDSIPLYQAAVCAAAAALARACQPRGRKAASNEPGRPYQTASDSSLPNSAKSSAIQGGTAAGCVLSPTLSSFV
jgi:hypothetical protein